MLRVYRYEGSPDAPYPPAPEVFADVEPGDRFARDRGAAMLGALPPYHFVDERGPTGIYRFFSYETPLGLSVSALRRPLEGDPETFGLGATNASFQAPTLAQVQATPPGATLSGAANDLLVFIAANGVPNEHVFNQQVDTFQTAWNADPLSNVNGANSQLDEDGDYGPNVHDALASIAGGTAPAVNPAPAPAPSPTPAPSGGGQTTKEPIPQPDATCAGWTVDATTPQVTAIAQNLSFHDSPVTWTDQGVYNTTINGTPYRFVMWWENGLKATAAYKCTGAATVQASTSSAVPAVILGTLFVGGLVTAGIAAKKPGGLLHRRRR